MPPTSRTELLELLGATQRNRMWSWSAVNHAERKVYFGVWRDLAKKRNGVDVSFIIQEADWGMETGTKSPARREQDDNLALALDHGYEAFAFLNDVKDPAAYPRKIARTITTHIHSIRLEPQPDGTILGYPTSRITIR
jgi:hypothetical protein